MRSGNWNNYGLRLLLLLLLEHHHHHHLLLLLQLLLELSFTLFLLTLFYEETDDQTDSHGNGKDDSKQYDVVQRIHGWLTSTEPPVTAYPTFQPIKKIYLKSDSLGALGNTSS